MRAITLLSAIGMLATASFANAAAPESPPSLQPLLDCWLKDHDWDQKEDLKCRVKVFLNTATAPETEPNVGPDSRGATPTPTPTSSGRVLVVDCDRHKKLVTHDFVTGENVDLWISAEEHRTLVSMRVEGIGARPTQNGEPYKLRANLLLANEILRRVDGFCKYTPPGPQPIPAQ